MSASVDSQALAPPRSSTARDFLQLAKPRITAFVVFTTAAGLWLAPHASLTRGKIWLTMIATVVVVAAANALNMYLEIDTDARMPRTASRPLPAGRMEPKAALWFGLILSAVSIPALTFGVGPIPGLLAAVALVSYVLFYTPLKRHSAAALLVGAVPGAIPPLIGWSAATGSVDLPGFLLFAVMFLWQVPHFLAISIFRAEDYAGAGLVVQPNQVGGQRAARINSVRYTTVIWPISLLWVPLGEAGAIYFWTAMAGGFLFVTAALAGLRETAGLKWARGLFALSLFYLTVLFGVLMFDRPAEPVFHQRAISDLAVAAALLVLVTEAAIFVYRARGPRAAERPGASRLLWAFVPAATLAGLCVWCSLLAN